MSYLDIIRAAMATQEAVVPVRKVVSPHRHYELNELNELSPRDREEADRLAATAVAAFAALRWPRDPARRRHIGELADAIDAAYLPHDLAALRLAVSCFLAAVQVAEREANQQAERVAASDPCPGQAAPPAEILRTFEREQVAAQQANERTTMPPPDDAPAPAAAESSESFSPASLFAT